MGYVIAITLAAILGLMLVAVTLVFGSTFVLAALHRSDLQPYQFAPEGVSLSKKEALDQIDQAEELGMQRLGTIASKASRQDNEPTALLMLSLDREVLAIISADQAIGYSLYSRLADGRWLETEQKLSDPGMSPYYDTARLNQATIKQTMAYHLDRVAAAAPACVSFIPDRVLEELYTQESRHVNYLVEHGLAKWLDPPQTAWRMTLRGAIKMAWLSARQPLGKEVVDRQQKYVNG